MILYQEFPSDARVGDKLKYPCRNLLQMAVTLIGIRSIIDKSLTTTYVISGSKGFSSSGCGQSTSSSVDSQFYAERHSQLQLRSSHHMMWLASSAGYKPLEAQLAEFDDPGT